MRVSIRDTPLMEITLRRYEKPQGMEDRELVRKLCLSLGLLQPGDSRDIIVDILLVLLQLRKEKTEISSDEINRLVIELRKERGLSLVGTAKSNIRRQLKRLRAMHLVEKRKAKYRINEFNRLSEIYTEKIQQFMLANIEVRVKEYLVEIDRRF
ncbi:MAG: hypothetical protein QXK37_00070 [Candidatus Woesearchaeota archaeon]